MTKTISTAVLVLTLGTYAHANQYTPHTYTNAISAHNISSFQHTITQAAFNGFGLQNQNTFNKKQSAAIINTPDLYGHAPMYGTELMYGEFNEDGTMGRSGGDSDTQFAALSNIWLNWQHTNSDIKFNNIAPISNKNDLIMAGLSGKQSKFGIFTHNWGINSGYIHSEQTNNDINTDSQGGFLGVFNGFYHNKFALNTNITAGVLDNSSQNKFGTDNYTSFWFGAAAGLSYDIVLDNSFILRPTINAEYTWIQSDDYTSVSGDRLYNKNFNIFKTSPELQAIKHIGNGWFGKLSVQYIMTFANDGDTIINTTNTINLNNTEYFEYTISIDKSVYNTNIHASVGRHDGDMYGWFGNINIKYLF